MASILVMYDLNQPGKDYAPLIDRLKRFGNYWHCLDSTWIVKSDLSTVQMRDMLAPLMDSNDELVVIDVTGDMAAWRALSNECSDWLKKNL